MLRRPLLTGLLLASFACTPPAPRLAVDDEYLDFGRVAAGATQTQTTIVRSEHDKALTLSLWSPYGSTAAPFSVVLPDPPVIAARGTIVLTATYSPNAYHSEATFELIGSGDGDDDKAPFTLIGSLLTGASQPVCAPPIVDGGGTGNLFGNGFGAVEVAVGQESWGCAQLNQPDPPGTPCQNTNSCQYYCCACPRSCARYQATACMADGCAPMEVACASVRTFIGLDTELCEPDGTDAGVRNSLSGAMAFAVASSGLTYPRSGDGGPDLSSLTIELSRGTSPIFCAAGSDGGAYEFDLHLRSSAGRIVPGIYRVGAGSSLSCDVDLIDTVGGNSLGQSGNVVLTAVTPDRVAGAFNANVLVPVSGNVSAISGTFDVPFCGYSP